MKKSVLALLILFAAILPDYSLADSIYNSEKLKIAFEISGKAKITGSGYIESATVNLSFFPKDFDWQKVTEFSGTPEFLQENGIIQFRYERPQEDVSFNVIAEVETVNDFPKIRQKIDFPIKDVDKSLLLYTKPSKTIDSEDEEIIKLANEIAAGEDDLYSAVFKVADWTKNNIRYDLSTLTADVSQKASWVLKNRQGVCDELTSLFIAMLRSLGVPARFASGIAYTNSELFDEDWGPHGWAEVYFPGVGWVPYDVTYGEFGWIDPGHVKFKDSIDPDESSTNYQWMASKADLEPQELEIKTALLSKEGKSQIPISMKVDFSQKEVKLGSYNIVIAEIENTGNFYYSTELSLVKPTEIEVLNGKSKGIVLLPFEKKSVAWAIRVDSGLDEKFSYTFPIIVATSNNVTARNEFVSSAREQYFSFDDIEEEFDLLMQESEKKYSGNVDIDCRPDKDEFYSFENVWIKCSLKNTGNAYIKDAKLCYYLKCHGTEIGISQEKEFEFRINSTETGARNEQISFRSELVEKRIPISFEVKDIPSIEVTEIIHPINVSYRQAASLSFIAARKSSSVPKDVSISLTQNSNKKEWAIADFFENRKYVVDFLGKSLKYGENDYRIDIKWKDDLGNSYETSEDFLINLNEANIVQRAALIFSSFANLSSGSLVVIFAVVGASFILLVRWLFKTK